MSTRRASAEANGRSGLHAAAAAAASAGAEQPSYKKAVTPERAQALFSIQPPPSSHARSASSQHASIFGLAPITEAKNSMNSKSPRADNKDKDDTAMFDPLGLLGPSSPRTSASPFSPTPIGRTVSGPNVMNIMGSPGKQRRALSNAGLPGAGAALPFTTPGFPAWDEQFRGPISPKNLNSLSQAFATKVKDPTNPLSPSFKKRDLFTFDAAQLSAAAPPSIQVAPAVAPITASSYSDDFLAQFDFSGIPQAPGGPVIQAPPAKIKPALILTPSAATKAANAAAETPKADKKSSKKKSAPSTPVSSNTKSSTPATPSSRNKKKADDSDSGTDSSEESDSEGEEGQPKKAKKPASARSSKGTPSSTPTNKKMGSQTPTAASSSFNATPKAKDEGKVMTAEQAREERARRREETLIRRKKEQQAAEIEEMKAEMVRSQKPADANKPEGAIAIASGVAALPTGIKALQAPLDQEPKRRPTGTEMKIDALPVMKKGTPFLKYGKHGFPHFRLFLLSENQEYIAWFSKGKKMHDTIVKLVDVDQMRIGQTTPTFARHPAPELASSSLSLIYKDGIRTLDLIAKDPNEFSIWTQALRQLIIKAKTNQHTKEHLKNIVVDVDVQHNKTSTHDLVDAVTGETAAQKDEKMGIVRTKKATNTGDKRLYREVAKQFQDLKKKTTRIKEQLSGNNKYYTNANFGTMNVIAKKLDDYIVRISLLFTDGEYEECDDEIWRACVELEGLQNLMKSI